MVTVKPLPNRTELPSYILNAANANFSTPEGTSTIFDYYYRSGKLPPGIKSKEDLLLAAQAVMDKSGGKFTSKQLEANAFGVNYQGPPLSVDKGTGRVKVDTRKYMSADGGLPPPVYDYIRKTYGVKTANLYTKAVKQEWKLMNLENQQLQSETGIAFDRGHWLANKFGGAESKRAGNNEIADLNRFRGADPRGDIKEVSKTSRASYGWLSDFHEWDLVNNSLNVTGSQYLTEADLQAISNGANESDRATIRDRLISQRIQEFERDGKPRSDRIGALFGSQLDRDETIKQQLDQLSELKDRRILEDGYDFSRGGMANERDIKAAQTRQATRLAKHQSLLQKGVTQGTTLSRHTTNPSGSITNAQVLPPSSLTFDSNGNPINPKPNILAIQKKGQLPTVTAPSLDTPRIGRTPYTGVVPKPPDAPKPNRIPLVGKDGIHPQELDVSYNAGLPGFGREVGNLLKNNLGGSIAGLGVGLMTDPELHQAVSNKDGLKVLNHIAKDTVGGAMTQAATRLLPGAVGARVAALANPIGAATLAAAAPSSSDLGKQREKLLAHVNRLPAAQKQTALAQIEKDDKAAAKPLIDGDAIVKKAVNEVEWGLKLLQGKAKNPPTPSNKPTPIPTTSKPPIKADLSGKLSAAQIRSFQAGGGQAAMLRDGLTREQVIERGSALLLKQKYG